MTRRFLLDSLGWGFILWLVGYVLGIALFPVVPTNVIGWVISPIGAALTIWIAFRKLKGDSLAWFAGVAAIWLLIAVVSDYFLIVKAFHPADGYYKLDVYIYYILTAAVPLAAGWRRAARAR